MPGSVSGYVLAGGRSRRMGTDKALLPWNGSTLGEFIARQVLHAAGNVRIVGGDVAEFTTVPDRVSGFGPVGGIFTALNDAESDWSLIVACDMPGLTALWLRQLLGAATVPALIPRTPDGQLHPLCAVWHRSALACFGSAVAGGVHAVTEAIRTLPYHIFETDNPLAVANVNTPEDWARFGEAAGRVRE